VIEGAHHIVVIEGTDWSSVDAAELARHVRQYVADDRPEMRAATRLAETIEERVEAGGGEAIVLTAEQKHVAYAVLNEWRRFLTIPDAVDSLYRLLAAP
jgi:hypothetical protein